MTSLMTCPHPNRDCYACELEALDRGSIDAEVTVADVDCVCHCGMVLIDHVGDVTSVHCLGCGASS